MVKNYTINGGKKTWTSKKKKINKLIQNLKRNKQKINLEKSVNHVKKMSQKIDDIIDMIESIKEKNNDEDIEDLLLNSIDDLRKVYELFKKIEDLKKELLEDEPLDCG